MSIYIKECEARGIKTKAHTRIKEVSVGFHDDDKNKKKAIRRCHDSSLFLFFTSSVHLHLLLILLRLLFFVYILSSFSIPSFFLSGELGEYREREREREVRRIERIENGYQAAQEPCGIRLLQKQRNRSGFTKERKL